MKNKSPKFKSEQEEREYWEKNDSADIVDWSKAQRVIFPELKPSTTSISIRLPDSLLAHIKYAANKRDIPYQSLIKVWLSEKVASVFETRGADSKQPALHNRKARRLESLKKQKRLQMSKLNRGGIR
jgi:predicted DNA binding CopG/RHH family protein